MWTRRLPRRSGARARGIRRRLRDRWRYLADLLAEADGLLREAGGLPVGHWEADERQEPVVVGRELSVEHADRPRPR